MSSNILTIDCDWAQTQEQLIELIRLCKHYHKHPEVYFVKEHQHCAKYLDPGDILYNVDEHHDLGYNEVAFKESENGIMYRGNWVRTLILHGQLKGYTWIKNYNSQVLEDEVANSSFTTIAGKLKTFTDDIKILYNREFKKIVISESVLTMPREWRFLYNALKEVFDTYKEENFGNIISYLQLNAK